MTSGSSRRRSCFLADQGGRVDPWMLDRPATRRVEDENGRFVSEVRYYYDGDRFSGLAAGPAWDGAVWCHGTNAG